MTVIVDPTPTGTGTGDVSFSFSALVSREAGLSELSVTMPQRTRAEWLRARCAASVEWTRRAAGFRWTERQALRAASTAAVLWVNETGWGERERRWALASVHCSPSSAECFVSGTERLVAYGSMLDGLSAFWERVRVQYPTALEEFPTGTLAAVHTLQVSGWTEHPMTDAELRSIYERVYREGFSDAGRAELVAPGQQYTGAPGPARRRRRGKVLMGVVAVLGLLAATKE